MNIDRRPQPVIQYANGMEVDAAAALVGKLDQGTLTELIINTPVENPNSFASVASLSQADWRQDSIVPGAHLDLDQGELAGITFE